MVRRAEPRDAAALERFCGNSLLGTYLACRLSCYGFGYDFVRFYVQTHDAHLTAALSTLDNTAVLLAHADADFAELSAFLQMMGFAGVMTSVDAAEMLDAVVFTRKKAFVYHGKADVPPVDDAEDLRAVYRLICAEIPGSFSDTEDAYLHFLSDFTFRRSRRAATAKAIYVNNTLAACALTAAQTKDAAVLSGVATARACRGKGFGRRVVCGLANELRKSGRTVYVIALNDSAQTFYQKLGFIYAQDIAIIERTPNV